MPTWRPSFWRSWRFSDVVAFNVERGPAFGEACEPLSASPPRHLSGASPAYERTLFDHLAGANCCSPPGTPDWTPGPAPRQPVSRRQGQLVRAAEAVATRSPPASWRSGPMSRHCSTPARHAARGRPGEDYRGFRLSAPLGFSFAIRSWPSPPQTSPVAERAIGSGLDLNIRRPRRIEEPPSTSVPGRHPVANWPDTRGCGEPSIAHVDSDRPVHRGPPLAGPGQGSAATGLRPSSGMRNTKPRRSCGNGLRRMTARGWEGPTQGRTSGAGLRISLSVPGYPGSPTHLAWLLIWQHSPPKGVCDEQKSWFPPSFFLVVEDELMLSGGARWTNR